MKNYGLLILFLLLLSVSAQAEENRFIKIENKRIQLKLDKKDLTFQVKDKLCHKTWKQKQVFNELVLLNFKKTYAKIDMEMMKKNTNYKFRVVMVFDKKNNNSNELKIELHDLRATEEIVYPQPIMDPKADLILPINEGLTWPAHESPLKPIDMPLYSGTSVSMPFYGLIENNSGFMVIAETPDDAYIRTEKIAGISTLYLKWAKRMQNSQIRSCRYIFINNCNIVKIAKKFKKYINNKGYRNLLQNKFPAKTNDPNYQKLIGAVQVWSVSKNDNDIVNDFTQKEIEKVIWHNTQAGVNPDIFDKWGYVPALYENHSEVIDPRFKYLLNDQFKNSIKDAWPKKVMLENGDWKKGIQVEHGNKSVNLGFMCDEFISQYVGKYTEKIKLNKKNIARYVDNLISMSLNECYDPNHRINRYNSRLFREEVLKKIYNSQAIVGVESGSYYAVNNTHFFTGMMSLSPFINYDSKNINRILNQVTDDYQNINCGYKYRVPLWELVFHDSVITSWYPGDGNNNIPKMWKLKDLFNILYSNSPLYVLDNDIWVQNKKKLEKSIKKNTNSLIYTMGSEMTGFDYLKKDKSVQLTRFGNGSFVIVNFGPTQYKYKNEIIKPLSHYQYVPKKLKIAAKIINEKREVNKNIKNKNLQPLVITMIICLLFIGIIFLIYKKK